MLNMCHKQIMYGKIKVELEYCEIYNKIKKNKNSSM